LKYIILSFIILFSACSTRFPHKHKYYNSSNIYYNIASKHNINYKTIHAICFTESSENPYTIHVNKGRYRGSYYFKSKYKALSFIKNKLKYSNYDTGMCQINNWWLKRLNIPIEYLLDRDYNIELATKIYKQNLKKCNNNIYCALSLYNTGKKKSKTGILYAKKVLKNRYILY